MALGTLLAGIIATLASCQTTVEPAPTTIDAVSSTASLADSPTSTTLTGETFDYRQVLVDWGHLFTRDDVLTVRGLLESAQDSIMVVDVVEETTGRDAPSGPIQFDISDLGLTSADQMSEVISQHGGPVWVLVVFTRTAFAMHIIELDDTGKRFAPPRDETPRLSTINIFLNYGFESGDFDYEDPETGSILEFVPGTDPVAEWIEFAIAAYQASQGS